MPKKNIELRSEEVKDILSKVPPWPIRWGNILFLALILLVVLATWFIKYPDVITADAYLTTEPSPQKLYAKVTTRIDTLMISDKQGVHYNQLLAVLENTSTHQDIYMLKSIMDTITLDKNALFFPFKSLPILFLGDVDMAFANFENSYFQYTMNRDLQPFANEAWTNTRSISELKKRLYSLIEQKKTTNTKLDIKKTDLERHEQLLLKGIISKQNYENIQLEYLKSLKTYQNMDVLISQIKEALRTTEQASKTIDYKRTRDETQLLKKVFHTYNQLKTAIKTWELNYALKSNVNGEVAFSKHWSSGQTVTTGDLIFTISAMHNPYYIARLKTPKTNSGKIRVGQKVNLKLYDYPEYDFGVIRGSIKSISAISDSGGAYSVDVIILKELETSFGQIIEFKQEMKGEADIITEDLRLIERFIYQFKEFYRL
ncbi:hemolysin D [Tamlana sedimentorum]|uniref:Hemolysin D n=1 Tax=Neotamlana sedimentorum TaxID=1435349 RepID=A0A0D7WF47_9FLAO|nr:HlyD family efflux transporter periplasmic adaptor subunit [Tamlana sedimentorum]KJD36362.1 hemolysin D [Tamlana sedimentorum]